MTGGNTDDPVAQTRAAVAGLARELEVLRRRLGRLDDLSTQVKDLARVVTTLAAEVANSSPGAAVGGPATSWLALPDDEHTARAVLDDLTSWMDAVYLRYADARRGLPACWLWHPDIVEELLWLMQAWTAAYRDDDATVSRAADWHDRHRPGVVRRIGELARNCSLEEHLPDRRTPERGVPAVSAVPAIAAWWGDDAQHCGIPPEPTPEQLAEDDPHGADPRGGGRR